ncbi:hypothetical protein ACN47E_001017 [Coniothyrium glycines]
MAVSLPSTTLSANDARILTALFDPETLPSSVARSKDASCIDTSLPPHPTIPPALLTTLEAEQTALVADITPTSSAHDIDAALASLDAIIAQHPEYPSAYVNRAMLLRMRLEATLSGAHTLFSASLPASSSSHPPSGSTRPVHIDTLFSDLALAIHLALPASAPTAPVSAYCARILRTAYAHRAYLYLKAADTGAALGGLQKSELEERASRDFAAAGRLGDEVAREMSVRTNPYKKMCGAIVREALREEMGELDR